MPESTNPNEEVTQLYPLFANLKGYRAVVVGAGSVAARKVKSLRKSGADVTVVAPEICPEIKRLAESGRVTLVERPYAKGDLDSALIAIAATSDRTVNETVFDDARAKPMFVNVVDVPELCNFIVPSTLERGMFQIAVTTGGAAPTIARNVRRDLEEAYPAWWEEYIAFLAEERSLIKARVPGPACQREPLYEILAASWLRDMFAQGESPNAEQVYENVIVPIVEGDAS